jgi:hypothetical protein
MPLPYPTTFYPHFNGVIVGSMKQMPAEKSKAPTFLPGLTFLLNERGV